MNQTAINEYYRKRRAKMLALYEKKKLTYQEIADKLGISKTRAGELICHARQEREKAVPA
jgi:DNA-binding transcriptional regulator LsrR (DeoR family)